jgi:hypothetical protein
MAAPMAAPMGAPYAAARSYAAAAPPPPPSYAPPPASPAPLDLDDDAAVTGSMAAMDFDEELAECGPMEPPPPPSMAQVPAMPRQAPPLLAATVQRSAVAKPKAEAGRAAEAARSSGGSAYLASLDTLARELDAQGRGRADAAAIRLIRQRLTEWTEDVRSVGGHDALAAAVEQLVQRLSAALASGGDVASEAVAIAAELARYAAGQAPPPAPKQGRAFWK